MGLLVQAVGGGLPGNIVRVLPEDLDVVVDESSWEPPRLFGELRRMGSVDPAEMRRVFNMGIGMVAVVPPHDATRALDVLRAAGHRATVIGEVTEGSREVRFT